MKISRNPRLNLNDYYANGISQTLVIKEYYTRMLEAIKKMDWIPDEKGPYNKIPSWTKDIVPAGPNERFQKEKELGKQSLANCPKEFRIALEEMLEDERVVGDLSSIYKLRLDFLDIWDGVEDMGWHWDGPCQSEMISLIYFNGQNLGEEYGGSVEAGIRDLPLGKDWPTEYNDVKSMGVFPPSGRTQVWLNNLNPALFTEQSSWLIMIHQESQ